MPLDRETRRLTLRESAHRNRRLEEHHRQRKVAALNPRPAAAPRAARNVSTPTCRTGSRARGNAMCSSAVHSPGSARAVFVEKVGGGDMMQQIP